MKLFVSSTKEEERYLCGPRLLATFDLDTFRYVRDNLTDVQLEAADGSGALTDSQSNTSLCWSQVNSGRCSVAVGFLPTWFSSAKLRRNHSKVCQALNASNTEINKDFLHENILGILLAETSGPDFE